jgi:3-oxoacyl-[acyl-carrier protein] reductase
VNKVIIITGTRKGVGRYLSEYYLKKDYIVIGCSRNESDLIKEKYEHFCLDVANEKEVKKMVSYVQKKYRRIDYLINNAGVASMNHSFLTPLFVVENLFRTNVFGTFIFCREVGKVMSRNKFGRIINFTTIASLLNLQGEAVYAASKASVKKLTMILAKEFGSNGITVNAIGPSPIMTDLIKNVDKEKLNSLLKRQAIPEFGSFEDVTNICDFYLSDNSKMISGQIIYLGGVF